MNLKKLQAKRIDLTLDDEAVSTYTLSMHKSALSAEFELVNGSLTSNPLYVVSGLKIQITLSGLFRLMKV